MAAKNVHSRHSVRDFKKSHTNGIGIVFNSREIKLLTLEIFKWEVHLLSRLREYICRRTENRSTSILLDESHGVTG